jgi:sortase A
VWALLTTLLVVVALAAAGYFAWQLWGTDYYTRYKQGHLNSQLEHGAPVPVSVAPVSTGPPGPSAVPVAPKPVLITSMPDALMDSAPVGKIRIPKIGLNMVFVMGTGEGQLALGPGLWRWGVMPGTPGNATISGHRTTYRHIDRLKLGDKIYIEIPGQPQAVFEVRGHTIASPFDVGVTGQTAGVRLTLTTCNPVASASQRLVVEAEEISGKYAQYALPRAQWKLKKK